MASARSASVGTAEPRTSSREPVERLPGRVHRPAEEPAAGDRRRGAKHARDLDRAVGVDGEPAARPAGVDRVTRFEQARADEAGVGIGHPRHDWDARSQPELCGRTGQQRTEDAGRREPRRDPLGGEPGPGDCVAIRVDLAGQARLGRDPGEQEPDPLPAGEVPTSLGRQWHVPLEPQRPGEDAEDPAGLAGRRAQVRLLAPRSSVHPGDRRVDRPAVGSRGDERRALAVDPDRPHLDRSGRDEELGGHRPDCGPPVGRVLLGGAGRAVRVERVGGPGEGEQTAVEPDETGLGLGRPEVDREESRGRHPRSVASRSSARSACGIVRQVRGKSGRQARKPAPSQAATALSRAPQARP